MKKYRLFIIAAIILSICLITGIIVYAKVNDENKKAPIEILGEDSGIDKYNPDEMVGFADYVFVAHVNEQTDTDYKEKHKVNGKETSTPVTNYSVTVIKNIKGV